MWQKFAVCCVIDGRTKANGEMLNYAAVTDEKTVEQLIYDKLKAIERESKIASCSRYLTC